MNTEKQKLENVLASEELKIFNTAIGTGTLDNYKEEDLKYDKIIIMSDADVDGYHIRTLWMTYIYRYMKPLITNGHLYLAQPPLYKVYKILILFILYFLIIKNVINNFFHRHSVFFYCLSNLQMLIRRLILFIVFLNR